MKLSRIAGAIALVASLCAVPLASAAPPMELAPGVQLDVPRLPVIHVDVPVLAVATVAAPLAQVDAGAVQLPDELAPLANASGHLIGPDGKPRWTVLLPVLVYLLVLATRKWVAPVLPEKIRDALQSRIGGIVLAALSALALAFLDFAITGGAFTTSAVLSVLIQWAYGTFGSIAGHETAKNVVQHAQGDAAGETAMVTLERAAGVGDRGPQP